MKKKITIVGGGAAAIMCACELDTSKYDITIYEKNKALGRKFLVAGKGGFNLTHSECVEDFVQRYSPKTFLENTIRNFTNEDLRNWLEHNAINTFVGSSNRVYPVKGVKPIEVLKTFESKLEEKGIIIKFNHTWQDWNSDGTLRFEEIESIASDYVIFALGGGSWKVTGSSGDWLDLFRKKGIKVEAFKASNCNFRVDWDANFILRVEGLPLKNVTISIDGKRQKGEAIITKKGIEGNAIYALSPLIRNNLVRGGKAIVKVDLKPVFNLQKVKEKLNLNTYSKITDKLKNELRLSKVSIELIKNVSSREEYNNMDTLAYIIKNLPISIVGLSPVDEAISSVGGIALTEVNEQFELNQVHNHFCIGEMLDWDAPTGGYLLQGCFSMGVEVARILNNRH